MGSKSHLTNSYPGKVGGYTVVDVCFSSLSIFSKRNGFGIWPSRKTLAGFVMRKNWPAPEAIHHWHKYMVKGAAVYRLYIKENIYGYLAKETEDSVPG